MAVFKFQGCWNEKKDGQRQTRGGNLKKPEKM